ncbi:MAG: hypothetical protein ACP5NC_02770 [Nitrososphaeria archaeon]
MRSYLGLPPRIKVLEAVSALASGRVKRIDGGFKVRASLGNREYTVILSGESAYSDDNGTVHRQYIGYPIIAVMIMEGNIPDFPELGRVISDVPWAKLNAVMRSYKKVEKHVKEVASRAGISDEMVDRYIEDVMGILRERRLKFKDLRQSTLSS